MRLFAFYSLLIWNPMAGRRRVFKGTQRTCLACHAAFEPKHGRQKHCSVKCGMTAPRDRSRCGRKRIFKGTTRFCLICRNPFEPKSRAQSCCSDPCSKKAAGNSMRKRYLVCLHCGSISAPRQTLGRMNRPRVFCSRECSQAHVKENGLRNFLEQVKEAQAAIAGPDLSPRDATKPYIPQSLRTTILKRDGYRCRQCGRELHDIKNRIDSLKATIDHIVPRCFGGTDSPENLRVLCHECNSIQGRIYGGLPWQQQPAVA
jgi:hypothetical protein